MTEFELKLEVPAERLQPLAAALRQGGARRERLRATYFDTPQGELARKGVVVRMRQEGRKWVQTAKAPGKGPLQRLEHNAPVGPGAAGMAPPVDLARHAGTAAGDAIRRALGLEPDAAFPPLAAQYLTDVTRLSVTVRHGESEIEVALDEGRIVAGARSLPVRELEIELKQGRPQDAVELARLGCALHGGWLSTLSKSMKGQRLAGTPARAPGGHGVHAGRPAGGAGLARAVVGACLDQVTHFASEVAGGSTDDEHIHQLRVGIRRLRTALREMGALAGGIDRAWEPPLVEVFRVLGRSRDRDQLARRVEPLIKGAGGPPLAPQQPVDDAPDGPAQAVRAPAFQDSLLALLAFAVGQAQHERVSPGAAKKRLRKALAKLHRQVIEDGCRFAALDEVRQHRVRKRVKRLRYLAEFSAPLFGARRTRDFAGRLEPLQDALGRYNDERIAARSYGALVASEPRAWFALGWLAARRDPGALACQQAIEAFARQRPFWD